MEEDNNFMQRLKQEIMRDFSSSS